MEHIGRNIRKFREARGLTQPQLADLAGTTQGHLSRIERGTKEASGRMLRRIAAALGIAEDELHRRQANAEVFAPKHRAAPLLEPDEVLHWMSKRGDVSVESTPVIAVDHLRPASTIAIRVRGSSMLPKFKDGDVVIISPDERPRPGCYVLADVNGEVLLREYRERVHDFVKGTIYDLVPLNPVYATSPSDLHEIVIIGVAVERIESLL